MAATRPDLRVGDAEREATATALREHYAQGRLSTDELSERLDAAFAATTHGQLEVVTHDLPHIQPARPEPARMPAATRRHLYLGWAGQMLAMLVTLAAVSTVVSVALHGGEHVGRTIATVIIAMLILRALIASVFGLRHHRHDENHEHHQHHQDRDRDRQDWDDARLDGPGRRPRGHHHEHHRRHGGHGYSYHYEYNYDYPGEPR
jgi:uncharacterized membrane protein